MLYYDEKMLCHIEISGAVVNYCKQKPEREIGSSVTLVYILSTRIDVFHFL